MRSNHSILGVALIACGGLLTACGDEDDTVLVVKPPDVGVVIPADQSVTATDGGVTTVDDGGNVTSGVVHDVIVGPDGQLVFTPVTLTIKVGDSVRWTFANAGDTVTSGGNSCVADARFCSPDDQRCTTLRTSNIGDVYVHHFTESGTFPYFSFARCTLGMAATIVVVP